MPDEFDPDALAAAPEPSPLPTIHDLVFVGLNGYAAAVHRETGEVVWVNDDMKSGYTTLLLDGDRLVVSTNGYLFALDPLTGKILWQNTMKELGMSGGPTALVSVRGQIGDPLIHMAAARAAAQAATAAGS